MANKIKNNKYIPQYNFGGWVKENKEGILGGLQVAGGAALAATGVGGPLGASLIASGVGGIAGEVMDGNSTDGQRQMVNPNMGSTPVQNNMFPYGGFVKKMAKGGFVDTTQVELEQGEVFMKPDGTISTIKDEDVISHKNGGAPMDLEVGTKILGKMKNKSTGNTFKEDAMNDISKPLGKLNKLEKKSKNKYTANAIKAMREKIKRKFNELYSQQEGSRKQPNDLRQFTKGGLNEGPGTGLTNMGTDPSNMLNSNWFNTSFNPDAPIAGITSDMMSQYNTQQPQRAVTSKSTPFIAGNINDGRVGPGTGEVVENRILGRQLVTPDQSMQDPSLSDVKSRQAGPIQEFLDSPGVSLGTKLKSIGTSALQYAPIAYNMFQSMRKPEKERLPENYNKGLSALRNRKFNIEPTLDANRTAQQVFDTNAIQSGAGSGSVMSNRLGSMGSRMRADSAAYAQKNNVENQYAGEYAQGEFGVGAAQRGVDVANLQNEAARRGFMSAGMGQMSNAVQRNQIMKNMSARDKQRLEILGKWYPMFAKQFGDIDFEL